MGALLEPVNAETFDYKTFRPADTTFWRFTIK